MPPAQAKDHGYLRQETAPVKAHLAEPAAGAGGGDPHGHSPPGHGKDGVPLVKQGRQDGEPGQVNYGLYLLWREADVVRNGPVLRAAGHMEGAVIPHRPKKVRVGALQVIGLVEPKQALSAEHGVSP